MKTKRARLLVSVENQVGKLDSKLRAIVLRIACHVMIRKMS
jgi:hypothetical protein